MRKFLRWTAGIVLVLLVCLGTLLLARESLLRRVAESRIQQKTGLKAHIGELRAPLGTATLAIRDFRLMNPSGFGTNFLLSVPEVFLQLDPAEAVSGRLRFRELRFHLEELNLVRNAHGQLNLEVLEGSLEGNIRTNSSATSTPAGLGLKFGGIDRLQLTLGRVRYTELANPHKNRLIALDVRNETATNLRTEEDVTNWVATLVFRMVMQQIYGRDAESSSRPEIVVERAWTNSPAPSVTPGP
jgi:uncharacterized protein involved in outer membrane biogenesis